MAFQMWESPPFRAGRMSMAVLVSMVVEVAFEVRK